MDTLHTTKLAVARTPHKPRVRTEKVVVVGLGYVGLPLAILARIQGYAVTGVDIDPRKRENIRAASVPDLNEAYLAELRREELKTSATFNAVHDAHIVIICVPTPVDDDHNPDLTPVISACEGVAAYLKRGQLVILESTVHPGTCEEVVIPILEKGSGLRAGKDFGVAHCPERINPGDNYWPISRIPRVVGATTPRALERAASFYRSVLEALVYEMKSIREAEAVKVVENAFRDINIAFVNELAMSFAKLDIDVTNVLEGASTKPFGFMLHQPGCGVGGHCIPVDPYYLIRYAKKNGFTHEFLSLARSINEKMPHFTVDTLADALKKHGHSLKNSTVALLGLSYKANVSDLRESPSFEIERLLKDAGARVQTFDPYAPERSSASSLRGALKNAVAAVVATAHNEFMTLSPQAFAAQGVRVVVDGRNCLPKDAFVEAGLTYRGIGR